MQHQGIEKIRLNWHNEATAKEIELQIPIPKLEQHIDLIWVPVKDLLSIDLKPEALKQFINLWLNQHADHMFIPYK